MQQQYDWIELSQYLKDSQKRIFIVTGKASFKLSGAESRIHEIAGNNELIFFNDFTPNPQLKDIEKGVLAFQKANPDLLISIGGGSTLDVAKSINFLSKLPEKDHLEALSNAKKFEENFYINHIAIPTTFGTGSESTSFATVYVGAKKYSLKARSCLPSGYLLDPQLGLSASPYIKACCGMDALCQAIESFWAKDATEESRAFAKKAIVILMEDLKGFVQGISENAIQNVARGSNLAGKAINISKTTAPHAISYGITQKFGIKHGQAVFLTLPYFLMQNLNQLPHKIAQKLLYCFKSNTPEEAVSKLIELANKIGLQSNLCDIVDLSAKDAHELADDINLERLANHPVIISHQDIVESILGSVLKENGPQK
jgi:alcohol dehydrogenase class IV